MMYRRIAGFMLLLLAGVGPLIFLIEFNFVIRPVEAATNQLTTSHDPLTRIVEVRVPQGDAAEFPYCINFEEGLSEYMYVDLEHNPPNMARVYIREPGYPGADNGTKTMITDSEQAGNSTRQAGVIVINLGGEDDVWLDFQIANEADEPNADDGVFISDNGGSTWVRIFDPTDYSYHYIRTRINLAHVAQQAGVALVDGFQVKFQSRTNSTFPSDGYGFDEICIRPAEAHIEMDLTVDTSPAGCGPANEIHAVAGTEATFCYSVTNTGEVTLTNHTLVDSELGVLLDNWPEILPPDEEMVFTHTAVLMDTGLHQATWVATVPQTAYSASASDDLQVTIHEPAGFPLCIEFDSTELPPYMYAVTSSDPRGSGRVQITDHYPGPGSEPYALDLDSGCSSCQTITYQSANMLINLLNQPVVWLDLYAYTHGNYGNAYIHLSENSGVTWSNTFSLVGEVDHYDHFSMNLTEHAANLGLEIDENFQIGIEGWSPVQIPGGGNSFDSICFGLEKLDIEVTATVGDDHAVCAENSRYNVPEFPAEVTFCYQVENTGEVTFTTHDVSDNVFGQMLEDEPLLLPPGGTYWFTRTKVITDRVLSEVWWAATPDADGRTIYDWSQALALDVPTEVTVSAFGEDGRYVVRPVAILFLIVCAFSGIILRLKLDKKGQGQ